MTIQDSAAKVAEQIGNDERPVKWRQALFWVAGLASMVIAVAAMTYTKHGNQEQVRFRTQLTERGDLTVKVSATGQLQPVTQVEVGTEVSGTIDRVEVDFNDRVRKGDVLARLDPDQSRAKQRNSRAALALAVAGVEEARATVTETAGKLRRVRDMDSKRMASAEELDTAAAAAGRAVAALAVAKAKVEQAQAQLDADNRTLEKTEIRSPIDGTVLKRQVEPGQTVAASLQTPVLFTLAEDLTQMELNVAVDEADVGQVAAGQHAEFTVDAYPNRRFPAIITQVRFAPETVGGVVTYAALLSLNNADLSLRPGMTATAEIVVKELNDVVLVPNTALRFTPAQPRTPKAEDRGLVGMLLPNRAPTSRRTPEVAAVKDKGARVWSLKDGVPTAADIKTGATDGTLTEVLEGSLEPGIQVLVDVERAVGKP